MWSAFAPRRRRLSSAGRLAVEGPEAASRCSNTGHVKTCLNISSPGAPNREEHRALSLSRAVGAFSSEGHMRKPAAPADLRPPITATPAWPRRRKRRVTFGHWPLEPVTQATAGRSLLVVPRAASMSPESVPQGSRCMCLEAAAQRCLLPCAPSAPHLDT